MCCGHTASACATQSFEKGIRRRLTKRLHKLCLIIHTEPDGADLFFGIAGKRLNIAPATLGHIRHVMV